MQESVKKYKNVVCLAIPSLIAIIIAEIVNIQVFISGPLAKKGEVMLFLWITLQMIPGFIFGYLSDLNFRKATLIVCQLLGLAGGLILWIFGFELWVLVLIALTFNPLPVARAAFLDHFPQHSTVKLVALTFVAQYLPWAFYAYIAKLHYQTTVAFVLYILALNIILTVFLFKKDNKEYKTEDTKHKIELFKNNSRLIRTLLAFTFAEAAFYLLWAYLENNPTGEVGLSTISLGTTIGVCIAMLYTRLPHISIITLFYSIGAVSALLAFYRCTSSTISCDDELLASMSYYCIIGGLYLPFVTDAVIKMLGSKRRALGSAMIELGDTIAVFFAPILNIFFHQNSTNILLTISIFFLIAALYQKSTEKHNLIHL